MSQNAQQPNSYPTSCVNPIMQYFNESSGMLTFSPIRYLDLMEISNKCVNKFPCGQCGYCRWKYSKDWAIRCVNEASMHDQNSFITLSYRNEDLPANGELVKSDQQKFIKKLRKEFPEKTIRYYQCGEYGSALGRPHYHALLFGVDFNDKEKYQKSKTGNWIYKSKQLQKLWKHGFAWTAEVNYFTARYVAGYVQKKINGDQAEQHYSRTDEKTGEIIQLPKEYATMSLKPGIGQTWYDENKNDLWKTDQIIIEGSDKIYKPPRFYADQYKKENPDGYKAMKKKRLDAMKLGKDPKRSEVASETIKKETEITEFFDSMTENQTES